MECPWCGAAMEEGRFYSRGHNYYLPDGQSLRWITNQSISTHGGVILPPDFYDTPSLHPDYPKTWHCRTCRKLVIPY